MTKSDKEITAKALRTDTSAISLLNTSILDFPFAKLKKLSVAMANVFVFIPPPVEAGDAPTHISKKISIMVEKFKADISMVLKPAVLGVAAPKRAVTNFPIPLCSFSVLLYSLI